jgi:BlaR1 peptidase M56
VTDWLLPQLLEHGVALLGTAVVLNTLVTFAGSLGFALLAARIAGSARLAKFILLTPWLRVLWDIVRGATPNAYVLSEHAGTKGALGSFQLGVGARPPLVPFVHAELQMQGGDHHYDYSVGDMLGHGLFRQLGATPLLVVLTVLLALSASLLAARAFHFFRWRARLARAEAEANARETLSVSGRVVQVITSVGDTLGPFTSGFLRPRVWLPANLDGVRRAAVLEHELAHVRDGDVLWFGLVGALADLFWFVPGARYLERRLHEHAEEAADARAVARGVAPRVLAESILAHTASPSFAPAPRMIGSAARLRRRLAALAPRPRESKKWLVLRLVLAASLTLSVFRSLFFGYI